MRILALFAILALVATSALAADEFLFRGTDQNFQPSCANPALNNAKPPLAGGPNSDQSHADFLSRLNKAPSSYSFEVENEGSLPATHSFLFPDPTEPVTASIVCAQVSGTCLYSIKNDTQDGAANAQFANCPSSNGRFPITGQQWLDVEENEDFSISFSPPVKGFSFFASDIGDRLGSLFIIVERADGSRITVDGSDNIPLVVVSEAANALTSGSRTFFGVYTTALAENQETEFISRVFFNKTVLPNAPSNDGFGFDEFSVLTKTIDPVGVCKCLIVYNWSPQCSFPNGLSVQDAEECACIRYETDLDRAACSTNIEACGADGSAGGGTQSGGGGSNGTPVTDRFVDNLLPSIVRIGN